jgi:hypothetical protein
MNAALAKTSIPLDVLDIGPVQFVKQACSEHAFPNMARRRLPLPF